MHQLRGTAGARRRRCTRSGSSGRPATASLVVPDDAVAPRRATLRSQDEHKGATHEPRDPGPRKDQHAAANRALSERKLNATAHHDMADREWPDRHWDVKGATLSWREVRHAWSVDGDLAEPRLAVEHKNRSFGHTAAVIEDRQGECQRRR
jgi:hypothetical protein